MFKIKSETTSKLFSNTAYQLIGKVMSMLITVLCTVIIARVYGRESFGEFNLMQAWPAFVFIIVDFGFNAIAAREIARDWKNAEKYFNTILYLRILLSCGFILLLTSLLHFFPYDSVLRNGIRLNLLLILTQALYASINVIFQPKLRYDLSTIAYVSGYIYILVAVILMSYFKMSVALISFNYVIGGIITFVVGSYLINKKLGVALTFKLDKKLAQQLVWQSLPLGLMFVFSQISFKSDSLMLSVLPLPSGLNNTESVAVYGLPYKIFEVGLVLPTFFMNAAYPVLVRHMHEGKDKLAKSLRNILMYLAGGAILTSIVGIAFSPLAIELIGGAEFSESVLVLQILLSGMILYFLTQPLAWLLVTMDKQKHLPYIYLAAAIFNVSTNYIFIQKYSFYASAVITHLSELLVLLLLVYFVRKEWNKKYA
jgi:PST family polysaccharide transporter